MREGDRAQPHLRTPPPQAGAPHTFAPGFACQLPDDPGRAQCVPTVAPYKAVQKVPIGTAFAPARSRDLGQLTAVEARHVPVRK